MNEWVRPRGHAAIPFGKNSIFQTFLFANLRFLICSKFLRFDILDVEDLRFTKKSKYKNNHSKSIKINDCYQNFDATRFILWVSRVALLTTYPAPSAPRGPTRIPLAWARAQLVQTPQPAHQGRLSVDVCLESTLTPPRIFSRTPLASAQIVRLVVSPAMVGDLDGNGISEIAVLGALELKDLKVTVRVGKNGFWQIVMLLESLGNTFMKKVMKTKSFETILEDL